MPVPVRCRWCGSGAGHGCRGQSRRGDRPCWRSWSRGGQRWCCRGTVSTVGTSAGQTSGAVSSAVSSASAVSTSQARGTSSTSSAEGVMLSTVVTVRINTGVDLVGDLRVVGAGVGAASVGGASSGVGTSQASGTSSSGSSSGAVGTSQARGTVSSTSSAKGIVLSAVVTVRVDAGVDLVGDLGVVRASVGAAVGASQARGAMVVPVP